MVVKIERYKDSEIAANSCLSRCRVCGNDCFYLKIFDESRRWWHESLELDWQHKAIPLGDGGRNVDN